MRSLAGPFWVTSKSYALPLHLLLICTPLTLTYMRPASYSTVIKSLAQSYTYAQRAWLHLFNFPCCYAVSVIIYRGFTFQPFTKMWISKQQMQHFPHRTDDDLHQKVSTCAPQDEHGSMGSLRNCTNQDILPFLGFRIMIMWFAGKHH